MIWILIFGAAFVILSIIAIFSRLNDTWYRRHPKDFILESFGWSFGFLAGAILLSFMFNGVFSAIPEQKSSSKFTQLEVLNDSSTVGGTFFLGSGVVDENPSFYFYERSGDFYDYRVIEAERARIKITDGEPKLETITYESGNRWISMFPATSKPTYIFHIPEGSIRTDYVLDADN